MKVLLIFTYIIIYYNSNNMNIYDCFMYFDEDLLLDIRLNHLNKFVHKFVITEANYTHNGSKKKLNFDINNFKKFKDKIIYITIDKEPENIKQLIEGESEEKKVKNLFLMVWLETIIQRENLQCIKKKGLSDLEAKDDDIILISDLDEILL